MDDVLRVERTENAVVARVQVTRFDDASTKRFRAEMREAAAGDTTLPFMLDMSGVTVLPSVALGPLVEASNELKLRDRRFVLVGARDEVRRVLSLTMLDTVIELRPTIEDALAG